MSRFSSLNVCAVVASMLAVLIITSHSFGQEVVHVDGENGSANPPGQGDDWGADAYKYLQDGLDRADVLIGDPNIETVQIWVAAVEDGSGNPVGYRPDQDASNPSGTDDPTATFEMIDQVEIYGGFDGTEKPSEFDLRDPENNLTILTGQLDTDNAYHVVSAIDVDETARLEGFTVSDGVADGSGADSRGGGLYAEDAWPRVHTCIFEDNTASDAGGAVYVDQSRAVSPEAMRMRFCELRYNGSNGTVTTDEGGAMAIDEAEVQLLRGFYFDNEAKVGGALAIHHSDVHISHVVTLHPTAMDHG